LVDKLQKARAEINDSLQHIGSSMGLKMWVCSVAHYAEPSAKPEGPRAGKGFLGGAPSLLSIS